jgi:hypothetical protein
MVFKNKFSGEKDILRSISDEATTSTPSSWPNFSGDVGGITSDRANAGNSAKAAMEPRIVKRKEGFQEKTLQ